MTDTYRTVAGSGEFAFAVRGSEFRARVAPADSVAAAEALRREAREAHPDATHVVPAYRVPAGAGGRGERREGDESPATTESGRGATGELLREYADDDGEPGGSAGDPALNVLRRRDLRNVAAAVVRHYGGTDLGVGGLARAYGRAVAGAVEDAGVTERAPRERFRVAVEYDDSGTVRAVLESAGVAFEADYGADVRFDVRASVPEAAKVRDRLRSATSDRVRFPSPEAAGGGDGDGDGGDGSGGDGDGGDGDGGDGDDRDVDADDVDGHGGEVSGDDGRGDAGSGTGPSPRDGGVGWR